MVFVIYAVIVLAIVYLSINLANYVDLLDKKSHLSGAFIGGVMLAAATSLPEFFTSISAATVVKNTTLVIGNIFGSNLFNLTIIGVLVLFSAKKFNSYTLSTNYRFNSLAVLGLTLVVLFFPDKFFFGLNIKSIIVLILYFIIIKMLGSENGESASENELSEKEKNMTINHIYLMFIVLSVGIIISSFALTYATDLISKKINLEASLAGALLLGIATSLPELVSSIHLFKIGNMNAVFGNVIGSNLFNLTILSITDLLSSDNIYIMNKTTLALICFNILSGLAPFLLLELKQHHYKKYGMYRVLGLLSIFSYLGYILFSVYFSN